ncbi:hypothetical protein ACP275_04G041100 [Erythranthe tilingii]
MAASQTFTFPPEYSHSLPLTTQPPPPPPFSHTNNNSGFPIIAVAILGIAATAFLLISYYIFVTKCCFRWQLIDPLTRCFSTTRQQSQLNDDPFASSYSPATWQTRGLNELLIRQIPTFQYTTNKHLGESSSRSTTTTLSKCVVCLNEFQDKDMLRILPKCGHAFHLDCIDIWLQTNSNCPLCRSTISGRNRFRFDRIVAPNSSPQDPIFASDEDFVEIQLTGGEDDDDSGGFLVQSRSNSWRKFFEQKRSRPRKSHHVSIMGDEGINVVREKDEQFCGVQPIRRSFSMDSAVDRHVYLSVQEILRQNRQLSEVRNYEESSGSRSRRSIFSFGHGRGSSRKSVLPFEF